MNPKYYAFNSPIGHLSIFFIDEGIIGLSFGDERHIFKYIEKYFGLPVKVHKDKYTYHQEIIEYLEGRLKGFTLPILLKGTEFQRRVWNELLNIPYGEIRTYKEIAEKINCPQGYRAVGNALNKNPIPIIVPCHRVIGANGKLTGFAGGLELKSKLLELERNNKNI